MAKQTVGQLLGATGTIEAYKPIVLGPDADIKQWRVQDATRVSDYFLRIQPLGGQSNQTGDVDQILLVQDGSALNGNALNSIRITGPSGSDYDNVTIGVHDAANRLALAITSVRNQSGFIVEDHQLSVDAVAGTFRDLDITIATALGLAEAVYGEDISFTANAGDNAGSILCGHKVTFDGAGPGLQYGLWVDLASTTFGTGLKIDNAVTGVSVGTAGNGTDKAFSASGAGTGLNLTNTTNPIASNTSSGSITTNSTPVSFIDSRNHDDLAADTYEGFLYRQTGDWPGAFASRPTLASLEYTGTVGAAGALSLLKGLVVDFSSATLTAGAMYSIHLDTIPGEGIYMSSLGGNARALYIDAQTNDRNNNNSIIDVTVDVSTAVAGDTFYLDFDFDYTGAMPAGRRQHLMKVTLTPNAGDGGSAATYLYSADVDGAGGGNYIGFYADGDGANMDTGFNAVACGVGLGVTALATGKAIEINAAGSVARTDATPIIDVDVDVNSTGAIVHQTNIDVTTALNNAEHLYGHTLVISGNASDDVLSLISGYHANLDVQSHATGANNTAAFRAEGYWRIGFDYTAGTNNGWAIWLDGETNDRTSEGQMIVVGTDINSTSYQVISMSTDITGALSAAETVDNIKLTMTGNAGDDAGSFIYGVHLIMDVGTGGLGTAISVSGSWDVGLSLGAGCDFTMGVANFGINGATPAAQIAHVADPAGGGTVDAEARTAINAILVTLETFGFHATS